MTYLHEVVDHQIQPTGDSCVATCYAIILGVPAEDLIERIHKPYKKGLAISTPCSTHAKGGWRTCRVAAKLRKNTIKPPLTMTKTPSPMC